jgi:hypothetical protein
MAFDVNFTVPAVKVSEAFPCFGYGVGSVSGPFAAFGRVLTEAGNIHFSRCLLIWLDVSDGESAQGVGSQAKVIENK